MGLQYLHLLVSRDKDFAPSAEVVREFLGRIVELGVVPGHPKFVLRIPNGRTREFASFTGGTIVVDHKDSTPFNTLPELESAAIGLADCEMMMSGEDRPKLPPLQIDFADPYCLAMTCFVSSELRSTLPESNGDRCDSRSAAGVFEHPEMVETIEMPEAGSARFWVEFEIGKFLVPKIANDNLELLAPRIVQAA